MHAAMIRAGTRTTGVAQPARPLAALEHARAGQVHSLRELQDFVRIPSISTAPERAGDVRRCAQWLAGQLRRVGLEHVAVVPTPRHPIVYADWRHRPGRPTVLIYGHYDVQPVDPLPQWRTPPFEPTVRGDYLYGRGASDDKGQLFAHLKALQAYLQAQGRLPVNVICLFEGEEEIGSPHLPSFLRLYRHRLDADVAVVSDTRMLAPDRPVITYALRGGLAVELELSGPRHDLHSGAFGGAVHNPLQVLCEIMASLHEKTGRVAIAGFYDRVRRYGAHERVALDGVAPPDTQILRDAGVAHGWGEQGYSAYERTTIRPALTINGISGGYAWPGGKAVIPARAVAKLSFRLVPDQDPGEIERLFRRHIARVTPPTIRAAVRSGLAAQPVEVDRHHPAMSAATLAYRRGFGAAPVFLRSGGSIPVVGAFQEVLGIPTVLMGFALPDDRMHAPNERFYLPNFYRGIATSIWFLAALAEQPRRARPAGCGA